MNTNNSPVVFMDRLIKGWEFIWESAAYIFKSLLVSGLVLFLVSGFFNLEVGLKVKNAETNKELLMMVSSREKGTMGQFYKPAEQDSVIIIKEND